MKTVFRMIDSNTRIACSLSLGVVRAVVATAGNGFCNGRLFARSAGVVKSSNTRRQSLDPAGIGTEAACQLDSGTIRGIRGPSGVTSPSALPYNDKRYEVDGFR